jgi:hypothetical protein
MLAAEKIMMPVSKGNDAYSYFQLQYVPLLPTYSAKPNAVAGDVAF